MSSSFFWHPTISRYSAVDIVSLNNPRINLSVVNLNRNIFFLILSSCVILKMSCVFITFSCQLFLVSIFLSYISHVTVQVVALTYWFEETALSKQTSQLLIQTSLFCKAFSTYFHLELHLFYGPLLEIAYASL